MTNSPWKGWFVSLWSESLSCHLPSLCSQASSQGTKLSEAPARNGRPKESWAASRAVELQWHQHSDISSWLFQHIQAVRGSGASTHWLFMAPPLGKWLCERPAASAGFKTQTGSVCAEGFAFQAWQWLCPSARACVRSKAEIQPCDPWPWALWLLGISHTSSATWNPPDIAAGPSWGAEKFLALLYSISQRGDYAELHFEVL